MARPSNRIANLIQAKDYKTILEIVAEFHGHYCPGIALGVMAAVSSLESLNREQVGSGMEDYLAVVETNNCFTDAVQIITGCTFGNNALVFRDLGKVALSLLQRDSADPTTGRGVRAIVKLDIRAALKQELPEFSRLFEEVVIYRNRAPQTLLEYQKIAKTASRRIIDYPSTELFQLTKSEQKIPFYAPIHPTVFCDRCKEPVMSTRARNDAEETLCLPCSQVPSFQLSGQGIEQQRA